VNFRSLEDLQISFDENFSTISGKNDSGKSNIFEAIKILIGSSQYEMYSPASIEFETDFPKWKESSSANDRIAISGLFTFEKSSDQTLKNFIKRQLSLDNGDIESFELEVSKIRSDSQHLVKIKALDQDAEGEPALEVWRRIRSASPLVFHNSTTDALRLNWGGGHGQFSELSQSFSTILAGFRADLRKRMKKEMAASQAELQGFLGRLSDKWKVSLDLPEFDAAIPFNVVLGDNAVSVPLNSWGSGTKNRAMIVLAMIRASQFRKQNDDASETIPIVVIEEPESFLHPSAQAEFGSLIIDLAAELDIQVIIATHSVYLLNTKFPKSNILICRKKQRGQARDSYVEVVDDSNWMKPFGEALGLSSESLAPWRSMLDARGKKVVLVEGSSDKIYLEMLMNSEHGNNSLDSSIAIVAYGGFGSITNQSVLRVMRELAHCVVTTCDLDVLDKVEPTFKSLQMKKGVDYLAIGNDIAGERCIEGLLPDHIKDDVLKNNPKLFRGLLDRTENDKSIRAKIKAAYLVEFQKSAKVGVDFDGLYNLGAAIKKSMA
jgi:putative ATP-dependent endonuclease of the OLD family